MNEKQKVIMNDFKMEKRIRNENLLNEIKSTKTPIRLRSLEASLEKGASNWLTTLPIKEHGFYLEKRAFWDALYLRFNIQLPNLPSKCVCGKLFTIDHALYPAQKEVLFQYDIMKYVISPLHSYPIVIETFTLNQH